MASRVDFPQPEGPEIDTYSPFFISMWMPAKAWVSTSSVRNTLVTPSSLIREMSLALIYLSSLRYGTSSDLVQSNSIVGVLRGHIRQNHRFSNLQSLRNLDKIHRATAQLHLHALRFLAIRIHLKEGHHAVRLTEHRACDKHYIV